MLIDRDEKVLFLWRRGLVPDRKAKASAAYASAGGYCRRYGAVDEGDGAATTG